MFTPIPADLFGQDLRDPYQLTIYDLPREMAASPISWGELLTIVIDYFLLTIDYFFVVLRSLRGEPKFQITIYRQDLQDLHRYFLFLFTMFIPVNPVYFKLINDYP